MLHFKPISLVLSMLAASKRYNEGQIKELEFSGRFGWHVLLKDRFLTQLKHCADNSKALINL